MKQKQLLEIMTNQQKTYIVHNNQLSIPASLLYEDWNLMSFENYRKKCQRGKLVQSRMRNSKGKEKVALMSYHHLPEYIKTICIEKLGDPGQMKTQTIQ